MKTQLSRALFQPPREILERRDSADFASVPKTAIVKSVNATLAAAVAFGAFAPSVQAVIDLQKKEAQER